MNRTRSIGIAIVLALALTAVAGAASASANNFKPQVAPESWSGAMIGKNVTFTFGKPVAGPETVSCTSSTLQGETASTTVSQVDLTPALSGCARVSGESGSFQTNGCKFRFDATSDFAEPAGSFSIVGCTKPMKSSSFWIGCSYEIPTQTYGDTISYRTELVGGVSTIVAKANIKHLAYVRVGNCPSGGAPGGFTDGELVAEWRLSGATVPGGVAAGLGYEQSPYSRFAVSSAPATVKVESVTGKFLGTPQGQGISCMPVATTSVSETVFTSVSVKPSLSGCSMQGQVEGVTATMGECVFKYAPPNSVSITGANCASSPIKFVNINPKSECTVTVGPQNFTTANFTINGGLVEKTGEVSGLTYTVSGPYCNGSAGTYSDGTYKQRFQISSSTGSIWMK